MIRRSVLGVVIAMLVAASASAQDFQRSIQREAARAAAQTGAAGSRPIPRGLLWTGIGLLGGGGFYLAAGAATDANERTCIGGECVGNRKVLLITGTVLAATGGALLALGVSKSHAAPFIAFTPGGIAVRQPVPFDLGMGHFRRRR